MFLYVGKATPVFTLRTVTGVNPLFQLPPLRLYVIVYSVFILLNVFCSTEVFPLAIFITSVNVLSRLYILSYISNLIIYCPAGIFSLKYVACVPTVLSVSDLYAGITSSVSTSYSPARTIFILSSASQFISIAIFPLPVTGTFISKMIKLSPAFISLLSIVPIKKTLPFSL